MEFEIRKRTKPPDAAQRRRRFRYRRPWGLYRDGQIVGSASVNTVGQAGVIDHVYTLEAYRHRGVARALMTHALDHCRRAMFESVILKRTIDFPARSLYESLGFEQLTTFASYHLAGV